MESKVCQELLESTMKLRDHHWRKPASGLRQTMPKTDKTCVLFAAAKCIRIDVAFHKRSLLKKMHMQIRVRIVSGPKV